MIKLITWITSHKLVTLLLLIVGYFLVRDFLLSREVMPYPTTSVGRSLNYAESAPALGMVSKAPIPDSVAPPSDQTNRLVIKDTTVSMVVTDVSHTISSIESLVQANGGFLVNSNISIPLGASTGDITVRIPEEKRPAVLEAIKKLGVKVTAEYVSGTDVTDQYVDTAARLDTLNATKAKFESILNSAVKVQDILEVQREIINLQQEIDNLKGQQKYLDQSAKLSLVTINLSTDELALPYTPDKGWRPAVIFKEAVRSLIGFARELGTWAIWLAVFSPLWLIALVVYFWLTKRAKKLSKPPTG